VLNAPTYRQRRWKNPDLKRRFGSAEQGHWNRLGSDAHSLSQRGLGPASQGPIEEIAEYLGLYKMYGAVTGSVYDPRQFHYHITTRSDACENRPSRKAIHIEFL
jgi:hypothetical protein